MSFTDLDNLITNTIRCFCADTVEKANSGHPGAPMGMAPLAHVLWSRHLKFTPSNPKWYNRDRFILSNGHACALLYTMLHFTGYEQFTEEQLKNFRQLGSITAGHPEAHYDGIEVTTGPLGQGFSNGVGIAIAEAHMSAIYNRPNFEIFNSHTFVFCGDGCLMEGITSEAASLAGHLRLGKLIVCYDDNSITIDGETELAFTEDVGKRFESYGWEVIVVPDGDSNFEAINNAFEAAKQSDRPTLIKVKTTIGFGSSKEGTEKVHGAPLGKDDLAAAKKKLGFDGNNSFFVPPEVRAFYAKLKEVSDSRAAEWSSLFAEYGKQYPQEAAEITRRFNGQLPDNWTSHLPRYTAKDAANSTRKLSQLALQALYPILPELMGGSADLAPSNLTIVNGMTSFQHDNHTGRNLHYGVREHAMAAIVNGLSAYGAFIPYGATFLNFLGYCQGAVTLSALSHHKCFYIMTHDSIGLGEDGPTHQPVEKFLVARSTPDLLFFRPADGNEVSGSYLFALQEHHRPSIFALSRHNIPHLEGSSVEAVGFGAYILQDSDPQSLPDVIIISTGTELSLCVDALKSPSLQGVHVRIVSMPCWELFDEQPSEYKLKVLPNGVPILSVEAGTTLGWSRFAHSSLGIDTFGASGKYQDVYAKFGLVPDNIANKAQELIKFFQSNDQRIVSPVSLPRFK